MSSPVNLYENVNYTANVDYIIGSYIREYDIAKANISILYWKGVLNREQYDFLYHADRMTRQVTIGKLRQKNPELGKALDAGIIEAKKIFFEANNIKDFDVLCIKNDAVYLINRTPNITRISDTVEFVCKNIYTSYLYINRVQYMYFYDPIMKKEVLDIKGIGEDNIEKHRNYFYEFLMELLYTATTDSIENTLMLIQDFSNKYVLGDLDLGYYREFNAASQFRIQGGLSYMEVTADHLPESSKGILNKSYNYSVLQELYKIFTQIYFNKR